MKNSYNGKKALLIGNGINRLFPKESLSWWQLLNELSERFNIAADLNNEFKPYTLLFEELLHRKPGMGPFQEMQKNLKQFIRQKIEKQLEGKKGFNEYHKKMMSLGYDDLLTTNYEYSFQKSIDSDFLKRKNSYALNRQEKKHSLKRGYNLSDESPTVWHIHGELEVPINYTNKSKNFAEESILIGYEQYADYMKKIRDAFDSGRGSRQDSSNNMKYRILNEVDSAFWMDKFFTQNIDIIGQGLDFSENHLWWILNQRANFIRNNEENELKIDNRIRFIYPKFSNENMIDTDQKDFLNKFINMRNNKLRSKASAELLKAFKVEDVIIKVDKEPTNEEAFREFYDRAIDQYLNKDNDQ